MRIAFNNETALALMRLARQGTWYNGIPARQCDLASPDPYPARRWTQRRLRLILGDLAQRRIHVAVPTAASRLRTKGVTNTVYAGGLPADAFVHISDEVCMSSPELLFVEMANRMGAATHLLLGYELCGTYVRDLFNPRDGDVMFWAAPATTVERLRTFVEEAHDIRGLDRARETLDRLGGCAWSPIEAIIATIAALPRYELGYGFHDLCLNQRVCLSDGGSRVPDILFGDTQVGINYDGDNHLDLDSVAQAAADAALQPDVGMLQDALQHAKRSTRSRFVDDIRRNRDLGSQGYMVFPVTKEDLYERGAFDKLMLQVYDAIEHFSSYDVSELRQYMTNPGLRQKSYELLLALLPGPRGLQYQHLLGKDW